MAKQDFKILLESLKLGEHSLIFEKYGLKHVEDITLLTPKDWKSLSQVLPFQRTKIIHAASSEAQNKIKKYETKKTVNDISGYKFSSNGSYCKSHKPENLKNFQAKGYGLTNTNDCYMKFTFQKPQNIYGVIVGNNIGVSGGWSNSYLQGVQIQVKAKDSNSHQTVHTISGMPNAEKTTYLAKIKKDNVQEINFWKTGYFSTQFIHFV